MVLENIPYLLLLKAANLIRIRDFENSLSPNFTTIWFCYFLVYGPASMFEGYKPQTCWNVMAAAASYVDTYGSWHKASEMYEK
jgi:hypothetical protein